MRGFYELLRPLSLKEEVWDLNFIQIIPRRVWRCSADTNAIFYNTLALSYPRIQLSRLCLEGCCCCFPPFVPVGRCRLENYADPGLGHVGSNKETEGAQVPRSLGYLPSFCQSSCICCVRSRLFNSKGLFVFGFVEEYPHIWIFPRCVIYSSLDGLFCLGHSFNPYSGHIQLCLDLHSLVYRA